MAMLVSGHRTGRMFDRYNIFDERDITVAGHKLENYLELLTKEGTKKGTIAERPEERVQ
jgi:hypothetical protein